MSKAQIKKETSKRTSRSKRKESPAPKKTSRAQKTEKKASVFLRMIVFFIIAMIAIIIGMVVGYSLIGDGELPDVFRFETWKHIFDIIWKDA